MQTRRLTLSMCLVNVTWRCDWETLLNTTTVLIGTECSMWSAWSSLKPGTRKKLQIRKVECLIALAMLWHVCEMIQALKFGGDSQDCEKTFMGGEPLAWRVCFWASKCAEVLSDGCKGQLHRLSHRLWWHFSMVPCPEGEGTFLCIVFEKFKLC